MEYFARKHGITAEQARELRAGIFAGGTMFDMVDNHKGLDEFLKHDPKLADARAQIEKERTAASQDRTDAHRS